MKKQLKARLEIFWLNNRKAIIGLAVGAAVAASGTAAAPYAPVLYQLLCSAAGGCQ